jgi:hypothetical protein
MHHIKVISQERDEILELMCEHIEETNRLYLAEVEGENVQDNGTSAGDCICLFSHRLSLIFLPRDARQTERLLIHIALQTFIWYRTSLFLKLVRRHDRGSCRSFSTVVRQCALSTWQVSITLTCNAPACYSVRAFVREYISPNRYERSAELLDDQVYKKMWRGFDTQWGIQVAWNRVFLTKLSPSVKMQFMTEVSTTLSLTNEQPRHDSLPLLCPHKVLAAHILYPPHRNGELCCTQLVALRSSRKSGWRRQVHFKVGGAYFCMFTSKWDLFMPMCFWHCPWLYPVTVPLHACMRNSPLLLT